MGHFCPPGSWFGFGSTTLLQTAYMKCILTTYKSELKEWYTKYHMKMCSIFWPPSTLHHGFSRLWECKERGAVGWRPTWCPSSPWWPAARVSHPQSGPPHSCPQTGPRHPSSSITVKPRKPCRKKYFMCRQERNDVFAKRTSDEKSHNYAIFSSRC